MLETVTLITCTGGRPEAFALCAKYMARQTYKGQIQWLVVDDLTAQPTAIPSLPQNIKAERLTAKTQWREGYNTQRPNMNEALPKVTGSIIAVIEDDDWYAPNYLEQNIAMLGSTKAIGETLNRYYNVKVPGHQTMPNTVHSSLASSLFRKELMPIMDRAVNSGELYFDVMFWRALTDKGIARSFHTGTGLYVGMKGLPGKPGITGSHRDTKGFMFDPGYGTLIQWVGTQDAAKYIAFHKLKEVAKNANPKEEKKTVQQSNRVVSQPRRVPPQMQIASRTSSQIPAKKV